MTDSGSPTIANEPSLGEMRATLGFIPEDVPQTRPLRRIGNPVIRQVLRLASAEILARAVISQMRERRADGTLVPVKEGDSKCPTLLALSPENFRGDLDVLAETGAFRVLQLSNRWLGQLVDTYYPTGLGTAVFHNPTKGSTIHERRGDLRYLLGRVLPIAYSYTRVDGVITANNRYRTDHDWGAVSNRIGVPYIVLFREGLLSSPPLYRHVLIRQRNMGHFEGAHIVAHNDLIRRMFLESGYASPAQVSVAGSLRMDRYLARIGDNKESARHNRISFFPFFRDVARLDDRDIHDTFDGAHASFVRAARDNPQIEFVFKPKSSEMDIWLRQMKAAARSAGLDPDGLPNLRIDPKADAQDLILRSDVVCGLHSTALLEAAIAGKPVVIPYFRRFREGPNHKAFLYYSFSHLFEIADDAHHFARLMLDRVAAPAVDEAIMTERRQVFSALVSDLKGGARARYVELLQDLLRVRSSASR